VINKAEQLVQQPGIDEMSEGSRAISMMEAYGTIMFVLARSQPSPEIPRIHLSSLSYKSPCVNYLLRHSQTEDMALDDGSSINR